MAKVKVNAVLRNPGSKWRIADFIIKKMSVHRSYLEPYFGSGAVFFNKPPSAIETINDIDDNVINLFTIIRNHAADLAKYIHDIPYARLSYSREVELCCRDDMSSAIRFLIDCWQGYGFRTNQHRSGWKRDVCGRERSYALACWNRLPQWIVECQERLKMAQIEHTDALPLIEQYNAKMC